MLNEDPREPSGPQRSHRTVYWRGFAMGFLAGSAVATGIALGVLAMVTA